MGQAKRRGTYEQRVAQAEDRDLGAMRKRQEATVRFQAAQDARRAQVAAQPQEKGRTPTGRTPSDPEPQELPRVGRRRPQNALVLMAALSMLSGGGGR